MNRSPHGVLVLLSGLVLAGLAAAEELAPYAYVTSSEDGRVYFRMVPDKESMGRGTLFVVSQEGGPDQAAWSVEGFWAPKVFVTSADARVMVRLGRSSSARDAGDQDLAIAFYRDGKRVRRYTNADLLGKEASTSVPRSTGPFPYVDFDDPPRFAHEEINGKPTLLFQIRLTVGRVRRFDPTTGEAIPGGSP